MSETQTHKPLRTLEDLLYLMKRLRNPDTGCPWDIKQSWQSITASTIEEAYEVVEAIEGGNRNKIKEELGDLLFQVVFYSQFAAEEQAFTFDEVVDTIVNKLISRHPHVFPSGDLRGQRDPQMQVDESSVNRSWDEIKTRERAARGETGLLADVAANIPALARAEKLQKRAARVGLDWEHGEQLFAKLREELGEIETVFVAGGDRESLSNELGDLLFTCVNLGRFFQLDCEHALRGANRKFESRVAWMEKQLAAQGKSLQDCNAKELDSYWEQAKQAGL